MTPEISLIIPVYNVEKYLEPCLQSVVAQTVFDKMQVILVDDGSKDGSPAICDKYAKEYANIQVLHKENGGVSAARNDGLSMAEGKYIVFADSDDLLREQMYEKLYTACEETGADLSFCDMVFQSKKGEQDVQYPFPKESVMTEAQVRTQIVPFMLSRETFNSLCHKMFRRSVISEQNLRLTEGKKYAEDREFVVEYLLHTKSAVYVSYPGYFYRYVPSSAVNKHRKDFLTPILEQYDSDKKQFMRFGISEADIIRQSAACYVRKIAAAIFFVKNKTPLFMRGKSMRAFVRNTGLHALLAEMIPFVQDSPLGYEENLILDTYAGKTMKIWILLYKTQLKTFLYNCFMKVKGRVKK